MATMPKTEPDIFGPGDGEEVTLPSTTALGTLEESALRSLINAAKASPRSVTKFVQELKEIVTMSPEVAQQMTYSLPRGDKQLIGPSIRFAEAVMYCWRNLAVDVRPLEVGAESLTAQAQIFDLERIGRFGWNTSRNITGKYGRYNADMIGVTMAAASSLAYRNAILKYVPKALWNPLWEQSKLASIGKVEAIGQKRLDAMDYFNKNGITSVQVFNALQISGIEDIGVDQLVTLRTWSNELKAGTKTVEEIFGTPFDDEIERTMKALGWNMQKMRMSRESFAGDPEGHLKQLRKLAADQGVTVEQKKTGPVEAKKEETSTPTSTTQQDHPEQAKASQNTTPESEPSDQTGQQTARTDSNVKPEAGGDGDFAGNVSTRASGSTPAIEDAATATPANKPAGRGKIRW